MIKNYIGNKKDFIETEEYVLLFWGYLNNIDELSQEVKKYKFNTENEYEIIIPLYEKYQNKLFSKLDGGFSIALLNKKNNNLTLACDKYGIKKLYYYNDDGILYFSDSLKDFDNVDFYDKEFNFELLNLYLCFNMNPSNETLYKGINILGQGSYITFYKKEFELNKYFELKFNNKKLSGDLIESSIKKYFKTDDTYASLLSSGVDSSLIVTVTKPEMTYTMGYSESKFDESIKAKELCKELNIKNKKVSITKEEYLERFKEVCKLIDEPISDPALPVVYNGFTKLDKKYKYVFSGEGADELFGGYNSYCDIVKYASYMKIPYFIRHTLSAISSLIPDARGFNFLYRNGLKIEDYYIGANRIFRDKEAISIIRDKDVIKTKDFTKSLYEIYSERSELEKRQMVDYTYYLIKDYISLLEFASNANNKMVKYPFLNNDIVDLALSLKQNDKISSNDTKLFLKREARKILPESIKINNKLGFPVPLRQWIYSDLFYKEIREKFESESAKKLFNVDKIIKLLEKKEMKNYKKVWTIYTIILWYENNFEVSL